MKNSPGSKMTELCLTICVDALGKLDGHVHSRPDLMTRNEAIRHILNIRGSFSDVEPHPDAGDSVPEHETVQLPEPKYMAAPASRRGVESRSKPPKENVNVTLPDVMVAGLEEFAEYTKDDEYGATLSVSALAEAHIREFLQYPWPDRTEPADGRKQTAGDYA